VALTDGKRPPSIELPVTTGPQYSTRFAPTSASEEAFRVKIDPLLKSQPEPVLGWLVGLFDRSFHFSPRRWT
jgi:hypothetical protein